MMKVSVETIELLQKGYESAFNQVYEAYERFLYFLIFTIVKNEEVAKDILQDVFIKIFIEAPHLRYAKNFHSWVIKVARNSALNAVKEMSRYVPLEECHLEKYVMESYTVKYNFDLPILFSAEDNLIIIYHLVYGISFKEIATMLKSTIDRIASRFYRILHKIKRMYLEREEAEKKDKN